jgi:5,10-methylenetetrahydromethanopterin reductase
VKFGFGHVPSEDYRQHVQLVQLAEELGFDYAWIADQTFHRDPVAVIAAAALATSRIQLAIGVANPYTRHPAMLARAAATLDEMAEGRFSLGIGAGNRKELLRPLGLDDGDAAIRCREMTELVRALLVGGPVVYHGKYFEADGVKLDFSARQDLQIFIAGRGPKVLEAAGAVADGAVVGGLCTPPGIGYAMDHIRRGAQTSRREVGEVVSWVTCYLTQDRAAATRNLTPVVAHIIGGAPAATLQAAGLPVELTERIKAVYLEKGITAAAALVTDECIDAFTIVGDVEECASRIAALEESGVTQFSFLLPPGDVDQHRGRLKAFAASVMPLVAQVRQ